MSSFDDEEDERIVRRSRRFQERLLQPELDVVDVWTWSVFTWRHLERLVLPDSNLWQCGRADVQQWDHPGSAASPQKPCVRIPAAEKLLITCSIMPCTCCGLTGVHCLDCV
ncbi:unnamed protein product, partial [Pleuronectes platessa]